METMECTQETLQREQLNYQEVLHDRRPYWIAKRVQDVVLSILGLAVLWPLMLIVALVVFLDDPHGSPIFVQKRVGRKGKIFDFYKFRTMRVDAEDMLEGLLAHNEMEGPAFKIKDDPRITRIGKFLRKTSIDELPQLWNVLRGDMTLVGPRPPLPREVEQYDDYQLQRLCVTPGLTCYWQVQPDRNELSFDEWVELDIRYIHDRCFRVDWILILKTFGAVLGMHGE